MINQFDKYKSADVIGETEQAEQIDEQIELLADITSPHRVSIDFTALARDTATLDRKLSSTSITTTTTTKMAPAGNATHPTDEKGPIEYFTRTKESLRHVTQPEPVLAASPKPVNDQNSIDTDDENYVKIPVQQLINTFEKQMRSIIKQKINENIQLKIDKEKMATNFDEPVYTGSNGIRNDDAVAQAHKSSISNGVTLINTNGNVPTERKHSDLLSSNVATTLPWTNNNNGIGQNAMPSEYASIDQSQSQANVEQINVDSYQANGTIDMNKANESQNQSDQSNGGKTFQITLFLCVLSAFEQIVFVFRLFSHHWLLLLLFLLLYFYTYVCIPKKYRLIVRGRSYVPYPQCNEIKYRKPHQYLTQRRLTHLMNKKTNQQINHPENVDPPWDFVICISIEPITSSVKTLYDVVASTHRTPRRVWSVTYVKWPLPN